MKKILSMILIFLFIFESLSFSQENNQEKINLLKYQMEKKSTLYPTLLSLIIPGAGQFYNRQYSKGINFLAFEIISGLLIIYEKEKNINYYYTYIVDDSHMGPSYYLTDSIKRPLVVYGIITASITTLWSSIDAYYSTKNKNKKLMKKYNIDFSSNRNKILISFKYHF